jgi:hypothetical protein
MNAECEATTCELCGSRSGDDICPDCEQRLDDLFNGRFI